jgi:SET domain-containing protein
MVPHMKILDKTYYIVKRAHAGLGLFARKEIQKKDLIIEYIGKMLTAAEANEKGGQYLFEISTRRTIDGTTRKNTARYINHSCAPNAEAIIEGSQVFVYAKKKIIPGEEITYDYGKEFFNTYIKSKGCRCVKCKIVN